MTGRRPASRTSRSLAAACAVLAASWWIGSGYARAHGGQVPDLQFWGPFSKRTLHCLRSLDQMAERCFRTALAARLECLRAQQGGASCDPATDARVGRAVAMIGEMVPRACLGGQLTELRFRDSADAIADVSRACGEQSAAVAGMLDVPGVESNPEGTLQCASRAADASRRVLDRSLRLTTRALGKMARTFLIPAEKEGLLSQVAADVAQLGSELAGSLDQACGDFRERFGTDAAALLAAMVRRADCIVGAVYVQSRIVCRSLCGDGVVEPGEQCDDGNLMDGDLCTGDCRRP
jgi:cysteine-rich repeat protein